MVVQWTDTAATAFGRLSEIEKAHGVSPSFPSLTTGSPIEISGSGIVVRDAHVPDPRTETEVAQGRVHRVLEHDRDRLQASCVRSPLTNTVIVAVVVLGANVACPLAGW